MRVGCSGTNRPSSVAPDGTKYPNTSRIRWVVNVEYTLSLPPFPRGANAAFGIVCPAKSRFSVDDEPTDARSVGNTCNHPDPCDPVAVTFTITADAPDGTFPPVIWNSRTTFACNGAPDRVSTRRAGVIGTNFEAPAGTEFAEDDPAAVNRPPAASSATTTSNLPKSPRRDTITAPPTARQGCQRRYSPPI
jgi:hypothetical protein